MSASAKLKSGLWFIGRLMGTGLVAIAVVTTAFHFYGRIRMPEKPALFTPNADISQRIEAAVTSTSAAFHIPTPAIQYEDSHIPGYTECSDKIPACILHLGRFLEKPYFVDHPESVIAVANHEAGHAVQAARKDNLNGYWTIAASIAGIWIAIFFWATTWLTILIGGLLAGAFFGGVPILPGSTVGLPGAYMLLMIGSALAFAFNGPKRSMWRRGVSTLPGIAGLAIFLIVSFQNHRHEYFSDLIAACRDNSVVPMQQGLQNIASDHGWARTISSAVSDPLHPTINSRLDALGRLAAPDALAHQCLRLHDGSSVAVASQY